jgi:SAM-dependent methyltransferase
VAAAARGCAVTAVDAAPRMVALLAAAHPHLDARVMDACAMELSASYDLATASFVLHIVDRPDRMLAGIRRALRPGGTVAVTVPGGPRDDGGRWDGFQALFAEFLARADHSRLPTNAVDVADALRDAGFVDHRTATITVHLPVADPQTCWRFHTAHGFVGLIRALSPADADELRARALAEFARMHADGGIVVDAGAVVHIARVARGLAR